MRRSCSFRPLPSGVPVQYPGVGVYFFTQSLSVCLHNTQVWVSLLMSSTASQRSAQVGVFLLFVSVIISFCFIIYFVIISSSYILAGYPTLSGNADAIAHWVRLVPKPATVRYPLGIHLIPRKWREATHRVPYCRMEHSFQILMKRI